MWGQIPLIDVGSNSIDLTSFRARDQFLTVTIMVPPPQKPIQGVQGVGPGVRNQTAMKVHVGAYQRKFRPRGPGRAWEDRTEKSKAVSIKNTAKQLAQLRKVNNHPGNAPPWVNDQARGGLRSF